MQQESWARVCSAGAGGARGLEERLGDTGLLPGVLCGEAGPCVSLDGRLAPGSKLPPGLGTSGVWVALPWVPLFPAFPHFSSVLYQKKKEKEKKK